MYALAPICSTTDEESLQTPKQARGRFLVLLLKEGSASGAVACITTATVASCIAIGVLETIALADRPISEEHAIAMIIGLWLGRDSVLRHIKTDCRPGFAASIELGVLSSISLAVNRLPENILFPSYPKPTEIFIKALSVNTIILQSPPLLRHYPGTLNQIFQHLAVFTAGLREVAIGCSQASAAIFAIRLETQDIANRRFPISAAKITTLLAITELTTRRFKSSFPIRDVAAATVLIAALDGHSINENAASENNISLLSGIALGGLAALTAETARKLIEEYADFRLPTISTEEHRDTSLLLGTCAGAALTAVCIASLPCTLAGVAVVSSVTSAFFVYQNWFDDE